MRKLWKGIAAAAVITLLNCIPALAAWGPGYYTYYSGYGPGYYNNYTPAGNYGTIYSYPGFNGAGPDFNYMINSFESDGYGPSYSTDCGWRYSPNGWWYQYEAGSWAYGGWECIDARWYYFDTNGYVKTGWLNDNGNTYYLNPTDDGTYGAMRTGWQVIDGKAYYFNASASRTLGALLTNTTTPDGYYVGADGALVVQ